MIGKRVMVLSGESFEVKEETPRMWVAHEMGSWGVRRKWRFPKKGGDSRVARDERGYTRTVFMTREALEIAAHEQEEQKWAHKHRWSISHHIQHGNLPVDVLRQVAALIGYKEPAQNS